MEEGDITPIYGYWIKENLGKYKFRTDEAKQLESAFIEVNLESESSSDKLIELYKRFLALFCNNMFAVAFKMTGSGVVSYELDAYLVKNDYGVMTPIGLLKENNKIFLYDIESNLNIALDSIKELESRMYSRFIPNQDKIDEITKRGIKPSKRRAVIGLLLSFIIICVMYVKRELIYDNINDNMMWVWLVIFILLLLLVFEAFIEHIKARAWKTFMIDCIFFKTIMNGASDAEQGLFNYSDKIKLAMQEGNKTLPENKSVYNNYSKLLNKKNINIERTLNYPARVKKSYGIFSFVLSIIILIWIGFGTREPYYNKFADFINQIGHNNDNKAVDGKEIDDYDDTDNSDSDAYEMIFSGYKKIDIKKADASSFLFIKSTNTSYSSANTCDGDITTSWQDGVKGDGIGEYLEYYFDGIQQLMYLNIYNGNLYSEKKYWDNNRPSIIKIDALEEGVVTASMEYNFEDIYTTEPAAINLAVDFEPVLCDKVIIYIVDVFHGAVYKDTCISEIDFFAGTYKMQDK